MRSNRSPRLLRVVPFAVLAALGTVAPGTAAVAATTPAGCGKVVTRKITLSSDIRGCPGDGMVIGADNITVNLNGHSVAGVGARGNSSVGIRLKGRHGVTVTNGTVTGFDAGVAIVGGSSNTFSALDVHDNIGPPSLSADFGDGFFLMSTANNTITGSHVAHNGPFDGIGVYGADPLATGKPGPDPATTGNKLLNNVVEDNNLPVMFFGHRSYQDSGINLGAGFTGGGRTMIANNVIRRNILNGITACSVFGNPCITTDNVIVNNDISENGQQFGIGPDSYGIDVVDVVHIPGTGFPNDNFHPDTNDIVASNRIHDNLYVGILVDTGNNRIVDNVVTGNDLQGSGWSGGDPLDIADINWPVQCGSNTWLGNTYGRGYPACTTTGGHQVTALSASSQSTSPAAAATTRAAALPRYEFHRGTSHQ